MFSAGQIIDAYPDFLPPVSPALLDSEYFPTASQPYLDTQTALNGIQARQDQMTTDNKWGLGLQTLSSVVGAVGQTWALVNQNDAAMHRINTQADIANANYEQQRQFLGDGEAALNSIQALQQQGNETSVELAQADSDLRVAQEQVNQQRVTDNFGRDGYPNGIPVASV